MTPQEKVELAELLEEKMFRLPEIEIKLGKAEDGILPIYIRHRPRRPAEERSLRKSRHYFWRMRPGSEVTGRSSRSKVREYC